MQCRNKIYIIVPGEPDTISFWDNLFFIISMIVLSIYHIWIVIKIVRARKIELPKIKMDSWQSKKVESEYDEKAVLRATLSDSVRIGPILYEQYIVKENYGNVPKRDY